MISAVENCPAGLLWPKSLLGSPYLTRCLLSPEKNMRGNPQPIFSGAKNRCCNGRDVEATGVRRWAEAYRRCARLRAAQPRKRTSLPSVTGMNLEGGAVLSEVSQTENDKYRMTSLIRGT